MNKTLITACLIILVLNIQCKKHVDNNNTIDVSQITHVDAAGSINGSVDNTDWTQDNNWTTTEQALFQTPTDAQLANTETGTVTVNPAYPNPAGNQQILAVNNSKPALLQIVFTDSLLSIKKRLFVNTVVGNQGFNYLLDPADFSNNTNYRVYYGFYSLADGLFYKGHGDIMISR